MTSETEGKSGERYPESKMKKVLPRSGRVISGLKIDHWI